MIEPQSTEGRALSSDVIRHVVGILILVFSMLITVLAIVTRQPTFVFVPLFVAFGGALTRAVTWMFPA